MYLIKSLLQKVKYGLGHNDSDTGCDRNLEMSLKEINMENKSSKTIRIEIFIPHIMMSYPVFRLSYALMLAHCIVLCLSYYLA